MSREMLSKQQNEEFYWKRDGASCVCKSVMVYFPTEGSNKLTAFVAFPSSLIPPKMIKAGVSGTAI